MSPGGGKTFLPETRTPSARCTCNMVHVYNYVLICEQSMNNPRSTFCCGCISCRKACKSALKKVVGGVRLVSVAQVDAQARC